MASRRVRRSRKGGVELRLPPEERQFLRGLAPQMREVIESEAGDDPARARLFPIAYPDDRDRQTEYRLLVQGELSESLLGALAALEESVDDERLDPERCESWLRAINQVRLVLGSRLGVTEEGDERPADPGDPRLAAFAAYDYLSMLQDQFIDALAG